MKKHRLPQMSLPQGFFSRFAFKGISLPRIPFGRISPGRLTALLLCLAFFTLILVFPLFSLFSKAFLNQEGTFVGFDNYLQYFQTPTLRNSIQNTFDIAMVTTVCSLLLGFLYAYGITRTRIKGKTFFKYTALLPIFMPTIVHALGLVYILGRQGILTQLGIRWELYGRLGIILSEIIFTFPQAVLMFYLALEVADGRLYEAADSMGVSGWKKFFHITVPEIKYTILSVFFVCFTLAFTDFGAPKVVGGSFNVLATDIYKQVAGQFNMNMGAVVGTLLLIPAVLAFVADRVVSSKNTGSVNAKTIPLQVKSNPVRDLCFFGFCTLITLCFFFLIGAICVGALTKYYPYDMGFTLRNFLFDSSAGGMDSFFNSVKMSFFTAVFGTAFVFVYAYMMEKTEGLGWLRKYGKLLSVLPLALPGMVVGLAFIFFFNAPENPLNFIYGTIIILVLSNVLHYFSVPFLTAAGCLKKLDREFESVSDSMSIPRWKTFLRVSVPLSLPTILELFMYYFVNAMVTVSAVVFLYHAQFTIASIAISHMEEAGNLNQAAAMSLLILLINLAVRLLYEVAIRLVKHKTKKRGEYHEKNQ